MAIESLGYVGLRSDRLADWADYAPGLKRDYFGFLGWKKHNATLWKTLHVDRLPTAVIPAIATSATSATRSPNSARAAPLILRPDGAFPVSIEISMI